MDILPSQPEVSTWTEEWSRSPAPIPQRAPVIDASTALVIVCDEDGRVLSMSPPLRALLFAADGVGDSTWDTGVAVPAALAALPLRQAATSVQHREVTLLLREPNGADRQTVWTVTPLCDARGEPRGALGVGRAVSTDVELQPEDWLAVAAHDLRDPATTVLGRMQLARRAAAEMDMANLAEALPLSIAQLNRHLDVAERCVMDLIRVMETLLDASAAASGKLVLQHEPGGVALDLLAREAVEHIQMRTSRHTIQLAVSGGPLVVDGDRIRLRQMLDNLLANAVKYAPDGGPIGVRVETIATPPASIFEPEHRQEPEDPTRWALLRVEDAGLGIPAEAVAHVFERYWRADGGTQHIPGAGLGLYTCRAIATAHRGCIWVETSTPQSIEEAGPHGTVMAVLLPLMPTSR